MLLKPLVLKAGEIQQLQQGDTLDAPQSGGDVISLTNNEAGAVVIGTAAYIDAVSGFKKAKADASGTSDVIGLIAKSPSITNGTSGSVMVNGVLVATTAQWDAVTGQSGGLTFNTAYFLSPTTAGLITITEPSTVGQYVVYIGRAISTTEMMINVERKILL